MILKRPSCNAPFDDMARTERDCAKKLKQGMYPEDLIDAAID